MKYTSGKKRKRINLIITSLELLSLNINADFIDKHPIVDRYHLLVQACGNINLLYKEKKKYENMTSDVVNSKMKQEATYVVTKYQDLKMLEEFPNKEKPKYLKSKDNPKDLMSKKKEKKNIDEISQEKQDLVSQIDSLLLGTSKKKITYNKPIQIEPMIEQNKTVNLITEIENKLNKKKKKNKNMNVVVNKKIINL